MGWRIIRASDHGGFVARAVNKMRVCKATLRAIIPRQQCADEVPHWQAFEAMPDEGFVPVREVGASAQRRPS